MSPGADREREREREQERERERRHRDEKHRGERREDYRDERDRYRERRRSRSPPRRRRSRSRSPERGAPPPRRERKTGFDLGPSGEHAAPIPLATIPGLLPGMAPFLGARPLQASMTLQDTRHARRIYIGGLPPTVEEAPLAALFNTAMSSIGAGVGESVMNVYINQEKKFAFIEFRTVDECTTALALDGIMFEGFPIRIRRPNDYNPMANLGAAPPMLGLPPMLGSFAPNAGEMPSDRILVSGLPVFLVEAQVKELLEAFGPIQALELVKNEAGENTGQAFALYADTALTTLACTGLNGMALGDKSLVVRRATAADGPLGPGFEHLAASLPPPPPPPPTASSRVLVLDNVVDEKELADDAEYADIEEDMREECGKYGTVLALRIPRPAATEDEPRTVGLGRVYVQYSSTVEAARARAALHGRKFGGNPVVGLEFDEDRFLAGDLA